jgi:hypothetical protein
MYCTCPDFERRREEYGEGFCEHLVLAISREHAAGRFWTRVVPPLRGVWRVGLDHATVLRWRAFRHEADAIRSTASTCRALRESSNGSLMSRQKQA